MDRQGNNNVNTYNNGRDTTKPKEMFSYKNYYYYYYDDDDNCYLYPDRFKYIVVAMCIYICILLTLH